MPFPPHGLWGGREFEIIQNHHPFVVSDQDVDKVLSQGLMLLPAVEMSTGPYQGHAMRWLGAEPAYGSGARSVALSYYLALTTQTCLDLTAATGPIIVEGPFAQNASYLAMLGASTGRPVLKNQSVTGTSIGAALLFGAAGSPAAQDRVQMPENSQQLANYGAAWRASAGHPPA